MKNSKFVAIKETLILALGEIICSAIICAVFLLIKKYDFTVLLGSIIGSAAIVLNFFFMSVAVNRAIDEAFALRGNYEDVPDMAPTDAADEASTDDGAESSCEDGTEKLDATMRFVNEQGLRVNRISKVSYIIRTATLLVLLVLALITKWFNPIATVIPMLAFRPIIMAEGLIRRKFGN